MICEFYHNKAIKKPLKPYNTPLLTVQTDPHEVHVSPTIRPQMPPPAATSTPLPTHSAPGPPASLDPLHGRCMVPAQDSPLARGMQFPTCLARSLTSSKSSFSSLLNKALPDATATSGLALLPSTAAFPLPCSVFFSHRVYHLDPLPHLLIKFIVWFCLHENISLAGVRIFVLFMEVSHTQ